MEKSRTLEASVDSETLWSWFVSYVLNEKEDPHLEFANYLNTDRQSAKRLAYMIAYDVRFSDIIESYK